MADELVVWWCGQRDHYLCVQEPELVNLEHVRAITLRDPLTPKVLRPYRDRGSLRVLIVKTLQKHGQMTIKALRAIVEPHDAQFYNLVSRMTEQGLLVRPRKGIVALKRKDAA